MSEIKGLTDPELQDKLNDERSANSKLRFDHAVSPLESPMKLRASRKDVARLMTELNTRKRNTAKA